MINIEEKNTRPECVKKWYNLARGIKTTRHKTRAGCK
jgi:hypothetical protein